MQKKIIAAPTDSDSHQFALYSSFSPIFEQYVGTEYLLKDCDLVHRITRVLKLRSGEQFVLFNRKQHMVLEIIESMRSDLKIRVVVTGKNKELQPRITFLLPVLKKEALEEAIYSLAELGVNDVQLVSTQKSRATLSDKDMQRLDKIVIAAAEQSKQYAFPTIYPIKNLQESLNDLSLKSDKIIFDILGSTFFEIRKQITSKEICLIIGPEGGLTEKELLMIEEQGFKKCSLTPTVLRALQAAALGAALFRIA